MEPSIAEWLLKKRYDELHVNFRTVWDLYLKFYTVFLTFNIAALAWIYGRAAPLGSRWPVAGAFIAQGILVSITSAKMAQFSRQAIGPISEVVAQLEAVALKKGEAFNRQDLFRMDLPTAIATWGGWANCIGVATMVGIWTVFLLVPMKGP